MKFFTHIVLFLLFLIPSSTLATDIVQRNADLLRQIGIDEKLGDYIPLDLVFTNENGEQVTLEQYFAEGRPVLLNLIYFRCPSICSLILNGVADGLRDLRWTPGNQFTVLTVSIDHNEDFELASQNREAYLRMLNRPGAENGWHFLTGTEDQIKALSDAVGFNFKWSEEAQEFLHGSAIMFLSPNGRVTRYLYGVQFSELNIRNALFDAADGRVGSTIERIMLYCFTFDEKTGAYTPYALGIMKVGGIAILFILGITIGLFWLRDRKKAHSDFGLDD